MKTNLNSLTSRLRGTRVLLGVGALLAGLVSTSFAAPRFVVKFANRDGSTAFPGECELPGYEGWSDAVAFGQGINRPAGDAFVGKTDFAFHKPLDAASPYLAQYAINGNSLHSVVIKYLGEQGPTTGLEPVCVELHHVRISGYRVGNGRLSPLGAGTDPRPMEEITLVWSGVELHYRDYDDNGQLVDESGMEFVAFESTEDPNFDDDGDGLANAVDPDDDNDGIADPYERANGLDPFLDDAQGDLDHDRQSNYDESVADTRADDARDFFRIDSVIYRTTPEGPEAAVKLRVRPGRHYKLRATADPSAPRDSWQLVDQFEVTEDYGDAPLEIVLQGPLVASASRLFFAAEVDLAP